jgi:menaquinol-cytochrome c reductase iron-sulfur subunit
VADRPERNEIEADDHRRSFFARLSVLLSAVIGAVVTLPPLGFVLAPIFARPKRVWRRIAPVDRFEIGTTTNVRFEDPSPEAWAGVTAETGAWLRRASDDEFIAFSINCRHLGCPVRWLEEASLFMCPCHGGVYYSDGDVAAGPPPEPLARYPVRVRDGYVEIEASPLPLTTNEPL